MRELAEELATTADRAEILRGLISLRNRLRDAGITDGYQWCAGSFCEDIEKSERRSPRDIDVVTFFVRPVHCNEEAAWRAFVSSNSAIFDPAQTKHDHKCDAYFVDVSTPLAAMISQVTYWYGLFAHQRSSHLWKGIVRVPLVSDDIDALDHLAKVWP